MICPRCLNQEAKYFYAYQDLVICRRCIHLDGLLADPSWSVEIPDSSLELPFELTKEQKAVSDWLLRFGFNQDVLIHAVCGAGKTEMVLEFVKEALDRGLKVGWMIARRQVVLQLQKRLSRLFPLMKVIAVCQGYTRDLQGDLILCTAHQLYRYPDYFDILIIDEPDAFPYVNDPLLEGLAKVACRGNTIFLTATPDIRLLNQVDNVITVHRRPHYRPLVEPYLIILPKWALYAKMIYILNRKCGQWLVFVPSIALANRLGKWFHLPVLTSETEDSEHLVLRFIRKECRILICTTILERGVTFEEVSVIVFLADSPLFDEAALIQISGRVGRSFYRSKGECYFLCSQKSRIVDGTMMTIRKHNQAVDYVSKT